MNRSFVITVLALCLLGIYLFFSAPPPLPETVKQSKSIPTRLALEILNNENRTIRGIYTKEIVGPAARAGLMFDENWEDDNVIAGPLPAQFLRETARYIETRRLQLGLFLGSDYAINPANTFEGEQLKLLQGMRADGGPAYTYATDTQRFVYMFPDVAIAPACTTCHNGHKDSPKKDWKLGQIMGAVTWTYPNDTVSYEELVLMISALREGARSAYRKVLEKFQRLPHPPLIAQQWPSNGRCLPDEATFMAEINRRLSPVTFNAVIKLAANINTQNKDKK